MTRLSLSVQGMGDEYYKGIGMNDSDNKNSFKKSHSSFLASIKNANSMFLHSGNKRILNLVVANLPLAGKDDYKKQEICQVCFIQFSKTRRQHHCRICADAVCSSCSSSSINKQRQIFKQLRCCDVCALKYSNQNKEATKQKILDELKGVALLYTQNKAEIEETLKKTSSEIKSPEELAQAQKKSEEKLASMTQKLEQLRNRKQAIHQQMKNIARSDAEELITNEK